MKTAKDLLNLLNTTDEHSRLEAKRASEAGKSIYETICSFSNEPELGGGYLLLGARKEGEFEDGRARYSLEGVPNPDKVQSDIVSGCSSIFNHQIRPEISVETIDGKNVLVVRIEELPEALKPLYFIKRGLPSGAFRRISSSDVRCTDEDMPVFYSKVDSFDSTIVQDADYEDIDENAIEYYRKLRATVNFAAEELTYDNKELLRALGAIKKDKFGILRITYTGLIVFGKTLALRRLMPSLRVDYIRVAGTRWIGAEEDRYESSLDLRGPLILLVQRVRNTILEDMPKGFHLSPGQLQAETPTDLPADALREALVNSFIHRTFRVNRPIQIIRYSNRIEIINPGFSLKAPDSLGEPGSELRNPFISEIFHDTNLAETKGSGIGSIRKQMKAANLMPPTFESNRTDNTFTARLLLHHMLNASDLSWLGRFKNYRLNNEQRLALIFVREVGAIDNITYRQISSQISSKQASSDLHNLCEQSLLEKKGQGNRVYYLPCDAFNNSEGKPLFDSTVAASPISNVSVSDDSYNIQKVSLSVPAQGASVPVQGTSVPAQDTSVLDDLTLAEDTERSIRAIGLRSNDSQKVDSAIIEACSQKPLSVNELSKILHRTENYLKSKFIKRLLAEKRLFYTIPEMKNHPNQKYTTHSEGEHK